MTTDRRALYSDLGAPRVKSEPPEATSVTQHVLRGTLDYQVQSVPASTSPDLTVRLQLGPVFIALKGRAAAHSALLLCRQLLPVLAELFPDLEAELARQREARALLNGTTTRARAPSF